MNRFILFLAFLVVVTIVFFVLSYFEFRKDHSFIDSDPQHEQGKIVRTMYLSGKIDGCYRWWIDLKFTLFDLWFSLKGYQVYNPARISKETDYIDAMFICIENMKKCDYVYFMPDWWLSDDARLEFCEAAKTGKKLLNMGYKVRAIYEILTPDPDA